MNLTEILDALQAENWALARERLQPLWQEQPGNADLARLAAYAANAEKHYEEAINFLQEACQKNPRADLYLSLGNIYSQLNQFDNALSNYQQALILKPALDEVYFNLGQLFLKQGEYQQALEPLQYWREKHPQHLPVIFQLATCHFQLQHYERAKDLFEKVLENNLHDVETLCNYGVCCLHEGDIAKAIHCFATALRIDENHLPSRSNLAAALLQAERYQEARDQYWQYLKLSPDDIEARYNYGICLMMLGELGEAEQIFTGILDLIENHIDSLHNLAVINIKKGEKQNAINFYQKILANKPKDEIANYLYSALTQQQNLPRAPSSYVKNLFDNYAKHFDKHLRDELHYHTPELLKQAIVKQHPKKFLTMLDLGCGTGLAGEAFKDLCEKKIGLDISTKMLAEAKNKNIYDELIEKDIDDYLAKTPEKFDLIIAADVLVYYGDLEKLFSLIIQHLKNNGIFAFSVEKTTHNNYELTASGRYQHQRDYLLRLAKQYQFKILSCEEKVLRKQDEKNVVGYIVILSR